VPLRGSPPAGSSRAPTPLAEVLRGVPHPRGQWPVVTDSGTAVVGAVSSARQRRAAQHPQWPRGRPSTTAATQAARKPKRLEPTGAEWCTHRHLGVRHALRPSARQPWWRSTRGVPQRRPGRELREPVSTVCDRRCRTPTALDKLTTRRQRLNRGTHRGATLTQRWAPTLEKALTVLDDPWLPSTSQAVARGKRRSRQRQKSLSRVRTHEQSKARSALDRGREAQGEGRDQTLQAVQKARAG